jgi:UDP-glucose 4-epimerase
MITSPHSTLDPGTPVIGVFGAGGFLGSHLASHLWSCGIDAHLFSRTFSAQPPPLGPIFYTDIDGSFSQGLEGLDVAIWLAGRGNPAACESRGVAGLVDSLAQFEEFIEKLISHNVRRIIYVSSGGVVYGSRTIPAVETDRIEPVGYYGINKLLEEMLLSRFHHVRGIEYTILRVANAYGPGQGQNRGQGIIPLAVTHAIRGEPLFIYGDGSAVRDYIYVDDVVAAIVAAARYDGAERILNIGTGLGTSLLQVIQLVEEILGIPIKLQFLPPRPFDVAINVLDSTLARRELHWEPTVPLTNGVRTIVSATRDAQIDGLKT